MFFEAEWGQVIQDKFYNTNYGLITEFFLMPKRGEKHGAGRIFENEPWNVPQNVLFKTWEKPRDYNGFLTSRINNFI